MGNPITDVIIGMGGKILDRVLPDQAARDEAKLKLLQLAQDGELATLKADTDLALGQLEVNKAEAASSSFFVSGWRPFIGWVCGLGLLYQFLLRPIFAALLGGVWAELDMGTLLTLLMGMLGLGGLRTFEKVQGVVR